MATAFRADLRDRLPLPLARLYRRAFNAKSRLERHHSAYFLLEATLKLAGAAQVAVWLASHRRDPAVEKRLKGLASPSVGHWAEFLREISARTAGLDPHPFPEVAGVSGTVREKREDLPDVVACLRAMGERVAGMAPHGSPKASPLDLFDRLPGYRNQTIGHGAQRDDAFYDEMAGRLLAAAVELLDRVPLFGRTVFAYVSEIRETPGGSRVADLWDLTGTDALAATAPGGTEGPATRLLAGHLYLKRGTEFLDLHPLLVCDPVPPEASVRFLNRSARERDAEYLDYVSGETSKAPHLLEDHRRILGRLLGIEVTPAAVADLCRDSLSDHPEPDPAAATAPLRKFGDFEILSRLGEGGMETVFLAYQRSVARLVALKVLPPAFSHDDVAVARFQRQIQALARADHANVVRILQSGRTEGTYWFAMEYVEGCDLSDVSKSLVGRGSRASLSGRDLARAVSTGSDRRREAARDVFPEVATQRRSPSPDFGEGSSFFVRLAEILRDAARGLHHLHERGIVHRDVKPGNVMVTRVDGRAVVIDPGLALLAGEASLTRGSSVLGSIPYAAPEQLQEQVLRMKVDARADVYGLGASLYDLATGRAPYEGASSEELLAAALRGAPTPPRRVDRAIPADLDAVIRKAMERDPGLRYGSADALADDLDRFARGEPVHARPPSLGRILRQWVARHRAVAAASVAAVIGIAVLTALFMASLREERDRAEVNAAEAQRQRVEAEASRREAMDQKAQAEGARALAERHREEAERSRQIAEEVNRFLNEDLLGSVAAGADTVQLTVGQLLDRASERIGERFRERPEVERTLRITLASAYSALGAYDAAVAHGKIALALAERTYGEDSLQAADAHEVLGLSLPRQTAPTLADLQASQEHLESAHRVRLARLGAEHGLTRRAFGYLAMDRGATLKNPMWLLLFAQLRGKGETNEQIAALVRRMTLEVDRAWREQGREPTLAIIDEMTTPVTKTAALEANAPWALAHYAGLLAKDGLLDAAEAFASWAYERGVARQGLRNAHTRFALAALVDILVQRKDEAKALPLVKLLFQVEREGKPGDVPSLNVAHWYMRLLRRSGNAAESLRIGKSEFARVEADDDGNPEEGARFLLELARAYGATGDTVGLEALLAKLGPAAATFREHLNDD